MVTVADVLAVEHLHLATATLPTPDAPVRWVATSELEDPSPFLEGGEVLLTTGLVTKGWRSSQWRRYVERLRGVGIAALGLGTGLTHRRVPAALVECCERAEVNLLEVPAATTFVAVSRATVRLLEEREHEAARDALEMQRLLTQAALREDDTGTLLDRLGRILEGAACLLSGEGAVREGPHGPAADRLDLDAVRQEVVRIRSQGMRASASLGAAGTATVVHPVGLRGRPTSYLAALTPGRFTEPQRNAVTTAVALLGLAIQRRLDRRDTERLIRTRAAELLAGNDVRTATLLLATAAGRSPDEIRVPARCQVIRVAGDAEDLEDVLLSLEGEAPVAAWHGAELWVLASPVQTSRLLGSLTRPALRVGVGEVVPLGRLSRSHATAGHALAQASESTPAVRWDRLVAEGPLALVDRDQARLFAESFLAPLAGSAEDELLETLRSFLRHHGSRGKVAEELGVHRNTVRNRIDAIEAALGDSLDDPRVRANAWVALQASET